MKIHLAGFNTDVEFGGTTPVTLSASYARISRDPRPIRQLREEACREVGKARDSNRRIVFDYGHGSVAEHAVFNFDVLDIHPYSNDYRTGCAMGGVVAAERLGRIRFGPHIFNSEDQLDRVAAILAAR